MAPASVTFTTTLHIRDGSELGPGPCQFYEDAPLACYIAAHAEFMASEYPGRFDIVGSRFEVTSSMGDDMPVTTPDEEPEP